MVQCRFEGWNWGKRQTDIAAVSLRLPRILAMAANDEFMAKGFEGILGLAMPGYATLIQECVDF